MEADTHWGVKWLFTDPDDSTSYTFNSALLLLDSLNWRNGDKRPPHPLKKLNDSEENSKQQCMGPINSACVNYVYLSR